MMVFIIECKTEAEYLGEIMDIFVNLRFFVCIVVVVQKVTICSKNQLPFVLVRIVMTSWNENSRLIRCNELIVSTIRK